MTISPEEYYARELSDLESEWVNGDFLALPKAMAFCFEARRPLPEWATTAGIAELLRAYEKGRRGRQAAGRPPSSEHAKRWRLVRLNLSPAFAGERKLPTKKAVCEQVVRVVGGNVEWTAIRDSYDLVENAIVRGENDLVGISDDELRWWQDRDEEE